MSEQILDGPWAQEDDGVIRELFHELFTLYTREEILKYHCEKRKWRFSERLIHLLAFPVFDMLEIPKEKLPLMFDSLLPNLTSIYLVHTEHDHYSRYDPNDLLIEITRTWSEIGKT